MSDAERRTDEERFRDWYRAGSSPEETRDLESRILARVRAAPRPSRAWWSRPRLFPAPALAAAVIAVAVAAAWWFRGDTAGRGAAQNVRFVFVAPDAKTVTLVGDFNGWDAAATPMHRDAREAPWVATVTLPRERRVFTYAFIVDGDEWMPDPNAPLASTGDFGSATSVLMLHDRRAGRRAL